MSCHVHYNNFNVYVTYYTGEDEIIKKRVLEWGDKGSGLWIKLSKRIE